jgi:hypothetical protein
MESETIQVWGEQQRTTQKEGLIVNISEQGKSLLQNVPLEDTSGDEYQVELTDKDKEKLKLLEDFIYVLSGKRIKFHVPKIRLDQQKLIELKATLSTPSSGEVQTLRQGWGLRYDYQESTFETEKMSFSSSGTVTATDGKTIDFNLNFNVSREFAEYRSLSIRAGDALLDPLVVNFSNTSATLGDRNYSFDIDTDGENETISFTGAGSGFLALDLNNNNSIDDGSELFGPRSGDGFGELSEFDADQNGWIDENDEIFNRLRIWTLDEKGEKTLLALGQAGVGAIYLGNVQSEFGLKSMNNTLGQIRQTGIFLKETGEPGTIQHVDLAV